MRAAWLLVWGMACAPEAGVDEVDDTSEPGLADNFGVRETQGEEGCDALIPDLCMYPYPSGAFIDDEGFLSIPEAGRIQGSAAGTMSTAALETHRGFGTASPVLLRLSGAVVPEGIGPYDPSPSLAADAKTLMIDASTGERIPHWVEIDSFAVTASPPVITMRPSIPLPRGTTVVVGLRGWEDEAGDPLAPSPAFAALRDQEASRWKGVHARRQHFEDVVFPTLEAQGVARDELQLAWSFPVRSGEEATSNLLGVRDAIFDAWPQDGLDVEWTSTLVCTPGDEPSGCPSGIRVILDGLLDIPSVMLPPDELGVRLVRRDADGDPVVDGVERWPFRLQLPDVAFEDEEAVPVLQYGHGFLGGRGEANNGWLRDQANRQGFAILATDLQGMSSEMYDIWVAVLVGDGGRFPELLDLSLQGITNQLVMQRWVATEFDGGPDGVGLLSDDSLAIDPDTVWYAGNSQGGSVGTLMMATSLDVTRGVLGVPGSGYPFLLHRSTVFSEVGLAIQLAYPEEDSVARFLALLGTGWDDVDPLSFAPHIHGDPLPGTPDHEVLLHVAKEDQQVGNEASFILGRAVGAVQMTPYVRKVWGLPEQTYPASPGAALVEVDFGVPSDPTPESPPDNVDEQDTHGWLRKWEPAQDQMEHFLRTGEVIDVCDDKPCVTDGQP